MQWMFVVIFLYYVIKKHIIDFQPILIMVFFLLMPARRIF